MTGSQPAPVIYDVHEGFHGYPRPFVDAYVAWLEMHGVDKMATYRTEHHLIDAPLVRVFQYDEDDQGCRYYDSEIDGVAVLPPFDVLVKVPAPSPDEFHDKDAT